MKWLAVFIGGGIGSIVRFALGLLISPSLSLFPWATLIANGIAAIIIGWLFSQGFKSENGFLWHLAAIGFCGGLSTFSTFSLETIQLMRSGQQFLAWSYLLLSVTLSLVLFYFISLLFQQR
jgi:CrcB protein